MPNQSPTKRSDEPAVLLLIVLLLLAVTLALLALLDPDSLREIANAFTLAIW